MRIGILGAGQLGKMLAMAGQQLGLSFTFWDPNPDSCAAELGRFVCAPYDDPDAFRNFVKDVDLVTYEFENVPLTLAQTLESETTLYPPSEALRVSQDRLVEKTFVAELGIPTTPFLPASTPEELRAACEEIGFPCLVKTRRFGYDGKGQVRIEDPSQLEGLWGDMSEYGLIVEEIVDFDFEGSIIGSFSSRKKAMYPIASNRHSSGILAETTVPAPYSSPELQSKAEEICASIATKLHYRGVLTVELFIRGTDLIVNEIAPRVHNSGHWTQNAPCSSQFENHLRAILDWSLGSTDINGYHTMLNLISECPDPATFGAPFGTHLHLYGKEPRKNRKLGHINICSKKESQVRELRDAALAALKEL